MFRQPLTSLLAAAALLLTLTGCNTVEGMGKDIRSAGQSIEKAASKNK